MKWGNLGGLILFSMSSAVIYLMTLYLQDILGFSPLVTGLAFAVPGAAAVAAGTVAPRFMDGPAPGHPGRDGPAGGGTRGGGTRRGGQ